MGEQIALAKSLVMLILLCLTPLTQAEGFLDRLPLLIKTTRAAYPRLEEVIRAQHPYELPEIIAVSVNAGLPGYLQWVAQETQVPEK